MTLRKLQTRIYADFFMPSRLDSYRALLQLAVNADYRFLSIEAFWHEIVDGAVDTGRHYLILRHDIDTDVQTAAAMWDIEREMGIKGSYFFRWSTLDVGLMCAIGEAGGQASYHYEELAALAKRKRLRRPADVIAHLPEARDCFRENLERLRVLTGLPMRVVVSHGDFVNRALGITNRVILESEGFRQAVGVELEVNDDAFMRHISSWHSDTQPPGHWVGDDPADAIERREAVIHLLVHPRHWYARRLVNARDDLQRAWQGVRYGQLR